MFASKVRNDFVPRLRREVWAKLKHLQTGACPFANLPEKKTNSIGAHPRDVLQFGLHLAK